MGSALWGVCGRDGVQCHSIASKSGRGIRGYIDVPRCTPTQGVVRCAHGSGTWHERTVMWTDPAASFSSSFLRSHHAPSAPDSARTEVFFARITEPLSSLWGGVRGGEATASAASEGSRAVTHHCVLAQVRPEPVEAKVDSATSVAGRGQPVYLDALVHQRGELGGVNGVVVALSAPPPAPPPPPYPILEAEDYGELLLIDRVT